MRALLVPDTGAIREIDFDENNPEQWESILEAPTAVDFINLREQGLQMIVDDHSITNARPMNSRITWYLKGTGRWLMQVHGPVIVLGLDPDAGESVPIPDVLAANLTGLG